MMTYVLYCDRLDAWFMCIRLGMFWECGPRETAREFSTRRQAVKVLQAHGKHREGWRVLAGGAIAQCARPGLYATQKAARADD